MVNKPEFELDISEIQILICITVLTYLIPPFLVYELKKNQDFNQDMKHHSFLSRWKINAQTEILKQCFKYWNFYSSLVCCVYNFKDLFN